MLFCSRPWSTDPEILAGGIAFLHEGARPSSTRTPRFTSPVLSCYSLLMHEMSIAQSLLQIIQQEMEKHPAAKLELVRVKHGQLTHIVPGSLYFAFEVLTKDTPLENAVLELEEIPLKVACGGCGAEFEPESEHPLLMPCPFCGEECGHTVLSGKELYLDHLVIVPATDDADDAENNAEME